MDPDQAADDDLGLIPMAGDGTDAAPVAEDKAVRRCTQPQDLHVCLR